MKVTVNFGEELTPVIQAHLDDSSVSVEGRVRAAVQLFNDISTHMKDSKNTLAARNTSTGVINYIFPSNYLDKHK